MRASELFGQTLRESPSEAEAASHRLLVRAACIRRVAAGVYAWLPLGLRVLRNVERIVRDEMDAAGAVEIAMPALHPAELWQRSGRWESMDVLYRVQDSSGRWFCLGPTHEEVVTVLGAGELASYRDLPKTVYQIQWKFRDEPRPRGGLLRGREFLMKDAYSFDADDDGLLASYERMARAYRRVFERCAVDAVQIDAHAGVIGGTVNHEFVAPSPSGEDTFVRCGACGYAANTEVAAMGTGEPLDFGDPSAPEKVNTPGLVTVAEVAAHLGTVARRLVKSLLYQSPDGVVCALVPGDRELNEYKLSKAVGGDVAMLGDDGFARRGWAKGFAGPVGLGGVRIVADHALREARDLVTGANEPDHHLVGVVIGRDFEPDDWADLVVAGEGDACATCGGPLDSSRGIEVGHIFQLGTGYSTALDAAFTDAAGARRPYVTGCYGLGVSRVVAAVVEQHHDERGIVWPRSIAPFEVVIVPIGRDAQAAANRLHAALGEADVRVLLDDRDASAGVRFSDADLVGHPLQLVVGRTFVERGLIEARVRATDERIDVVADADAVLAVLDRCP